MNEWVSLHHHTTYSFQLRDGFGTPDEHLHRAEELGYGAMAFTEHGNVSSHFHAEKAAAKTGVRPIFGLEAYCAPVDEEHKTRIKNHLILLAMDASGYRNLNGLVTQSWVDFYQYPTVGGTALTEFQDGLICLSGCTGSLLACTLIGGKQFERNDTRSLDTPDIDGAIAIASRFRSLFGDRYYLECQGFHELADTRVINPSYEILSRELDIPLVATMDVHYPHPDDNIMQQIIHAADRGGKTIDQQSQTWEYDVRLTLPLSDNDIYQKMKATGLSPIAARGAVEMAGIIAARCDVTLPKAERLRYPDGPEEWETWPERK